MEVAPQAVSHGAVDFRHVEEHQPPSPIPRAIPKSFRIATAQSAYPACFGQPMETIPVIAGLSFDQILFLKALQLAEETVTEAQPSKESVKFRKVGRVSVSQAQSNMHRNSSDLGFINGTLPYSVCHATINDAVVHFIVALNFNGSGDAGIRFRRKVVDVAIKLVLGSRVLDVRANDQFQAGFPQRRLTRKTTSSGSPTMRMCRITPVFASESRNSSQWL